jgi:hypothetical protein
MSLLRSPFVQALEESFRAPLDDLARARGWPTSSEIARLGGLVQRLSEAYNASDAAPPRTENTLGARLIFSFPRDVPKGAAAVRELVRSGALVLPEGRPLRVLDVGAGLGASSRGVARALAGRSGVGEILVDAVDPDGAALDLASAIVRTRPREGGVTIGLQVIRGSAGARLAARGPYDLIILGQVLSELDRDMVDGRVSRHALLLQAYAEDLSANGSLVIIEPALRERTRHLHAVRDALLAGSVSIRLNVFAPCLHDAPCPMLPVGNAWCHEDLDVDLPPWLVPVARAAGLRWQGLTFSYLVLRKDGQTQATGRPRRLRVVSGPVVTKGKRELFLCGVSEGADTASRLKVMRLDRHRAPENADWDEAARGDVLTLEPPPTAAHPRVDAATTVVRAPHGG